MARLGSHRDNRGGLTEEMNLATDAKNEDATVRWTGIREKKGVSTILEHRCRQHRVLQIGVDSVCLVLAANALLSEIFRMAM